MSRRFRRWSRRDLVVATVGAIAAALTLAAAACSGGPAEVAATGTWRSGAPR